MDFIFPYSESKIKPYLKMAVHRINLANNKKTTQVKHAKREIADLLGIHKDEKARIKVEHIIREDFTIEGYEILELLCELMHERIRQITNAKECPDELREAASSLIWAAHNVDIDELREVANQLTKKFGSKFSKAALNNENNVVNDRLFQKLSYRPPSAYLVIKYLEEIARTYDIDWEPSESELSNLATMANDQPFSSPSGSSIAMAPGSGLTSAYRAAGPAPEPPQLPPLNDYERAEYEQFLRNQGPVVATATPVVDTDIGNTSGIGPAAIPGPAPHQIQKVDQSPPPSATPIYPPAAAAYQPQAPDAHATAFVPPTSPPPPVPAPAPAPAPSAPTNNDNDDPIAALQARLNALKKDG